MIKAETVIIAQFYDLDPMQVVWHGNYVRYFEQARGILLDKIGYNYPQMDADGYMWPIVELQVKYVRPVRLAQVIRVEARLVEYENRLKIAYTIRAESTGEVLTKAHTTQLAVRQSTQELCLETPPQLVAKIRQALCAPQ